MDNEVIGNGLLGRAFKSANTTDCLFFCSGVSDSNEVKSEAFLREEKLLRETLLKANDNHQHFVYFSSVAAPSSNTNYFNHKIEMENLIKKFSSNYYILRLPQVAGPVLNTTLLPTIIKNIYENRYFKVFKNAKRTLVDVEDIVILFEDILSNSNGNKVINICPGYCFSPEELVLLVSKNIDTQPKYDLIDLGTEQKCLLDDSIESTVVRHFFDNKNRENDYLDKVVKKYTPEIIKIIENS